MNFMETRLKGAFLIELDKIEDERGFFARTFCANEFEAHGLNPRIVQCNVSYNIKRGTIRGMHFQSDPHQEAKLVSCIKGSLYDVIVDLRKSSPTYCQWYGVELSEAHPKYFYIPEGFAHGFQTLKDDTVVFYQMSEFYHPECASGARWNDPAFGIEWPLPEPTISDRDNTYPDFMRD
ncbi:MAG: dTDP-4-dehydrorhamnose 3,5-epimerase [Candidatus Solincola sediminis]|nr:MAG: dTDP-4-dehydrorhamnose 3,5-epimerase [Candidatus Solincola sediminis]